MRRPRHATTLRWVVLAAVWLVLSTATATTLFLTSSRETVLASHDAVLRPSFDGHAVLRTGPVLPNFRMATAGPVGVTIDLGKTEAASTGELFQRYALIAAEPDAQIEKARRLVVDMAVAAVLRGAAVGCLPVVVYLLLGPVRRRELWQSVRQRHPRALVGTLALVLLTVAFWQPWQSRDESLDESRRWVPLADYLGDEVSLPAGADGVEIRVDAATDSSKRLFESALSTYDKSKEFYAQAVEDAAELDLREPEDGETVVTLVSDRHDNIGMDKVARAIGDAGGATAVFDAGDDTSSGKAWEAFSLDSLDNAFDDLDRWAVAGNHDNGPFVGDYLSDLGWTTFDGEVIDGPGDTTLLGVDDPRSSGLGSWRDETGLSFEEVGDRLADAACAAEERVSTILVHDANLGREALARGCADLVVGGHLHVEVGPTAVTGEDGSTGWTYTTGTTGGAAYAIAVGSKPRRDAQVALITYAEGRPAGIQSVLLRTDGRFKVGPWVPVPTD
ncbi:metallophosphoesterase [Nocardioides sp. LHG3406-4]|uniref:metallophosphoesterase n=1 Tax=Nocardioides sp. LHG3406-4 TaxID=2804575 RepID=UPI003CEC87C4